MTKQLSFTRTGLLCIAAAAALCATVTPASAADVLRWQYRHGDKVLAAGDSTLETEPTGPSNHASTTTVAFAAIQNGMTFATECTPNAGKVPILKTQLRRYGSSMSIERVGPKAFQVRFQNQDPLSVTSVTNSDGCTVQMADQHGSSTDQAVSLAYGQTVTLPLGQDGYSIELLLSTSTGSANNAQ